MSRPVVRHRRHFERSSVSLRVHDPRQRSQHARVSGLPRCGAPRPSAVAFGPERKRVGTPPRQARAGCSRARPTETRSERAGSRGPWPAQRPFPPTPAAEPRKLERGAPGPRPAVAESSNASQTGDGVVAPHASGVEALRVLPQHALGGEARERGARARSSRARARRAGSRRRRARRRAGSTSCSIRSKAAAASRSSWSPRVAARRRDGPAGLAVVGLLPPAVEDAQVEAAVQGDLHPARPARLERRARQVQPQVDAGDDARRDAQVVVLEEDDVAADVRRAAHLEQRLQGLLRLLVLGMGLAGDDQLDRRARSSARRRRPRSSRRVSRWRRL